MGEVAGDCLIGEVSGEKFGPKELTLSSESDIVQSTK